MHLLVHPFHDAHAGVIAYVVTNPASDRCALVDAHLLGSVGSPGQGARPLSRMIEFVRVNGLVVEWMLATRCDPHAANTVRELKRHFVCAQLGARASTPDLAGARSNSASGNRDAGRTRGALHPDRLFGDGERVSIGHACGRVLHTPDLLTGSVVYTFDGVAFTGAADLGHRAARRNGESAHSFAAVDCERGWMKQLAPNTRLFVGIEGALADEDLPCMTMAGRVSGNGSRLLDRGTVAP